MHNTILKANQIVEAVATRFNFDETTKQEVYEQILAILSEDQPVKEDKPVGAATIVQEITPIENFPAHDENLPSDG